MYEEILKYTEELKGFLIERRRDFHAHPEKGWEEVRTSSIIAKILTELGYEVLVGEDVLVPEDRMGVPPREVLEKTYERALANGAVPEFAERMKGGMTGVIGILRTGRPGPVVGMRFDIDALPLIESASADHAPKQNGFRSTFEGNMHACGHDGHATIGLGVACQLMKLKDKLKGTFKLAFQPAEEGVRGAKSIVSKGHFDDVDYFIGSHITKLPEGKDFDIYPGSGGSLATTKINALIKGKSAHAAGSPESGVNANLAMATAILNLHAIPRHGKGANRINVGVARGGTGRNIIPDEAYLELETRGATTEINAYVRDYAYSVLESSAKMHGCSIELSLAGEADSLESDPAMMDIVARAADAIGMKMPEQRRLPLGGSEDVSYMMKRVQEHGGLATFIRLMTPVAASAHNVCYDFDERVLANGVNIFTATVMEIMKL